MINRRVKRVVIETFKGEGIVGTNCFVNVTSAGVTVKDTKAHSGAFYQWQWVEAARFEFGE